MKIITISRGSIQILLNNKEIIIQGEAMMIKPAPELSEYVVFKNSIKWKDPAEKEILDNKLINNILDSLEIELRKRNLRMIIE